MATKGRTKFPEIKKSRKGDFTKWAKKKFDETGSNDFKDTCSAASSVVKDKSKYSKEVVAMANYANNFGCKTK
jgi:hypothetical protein